MSPYFNATGNYAPRWGVVVASSIIVFLVNLSGITGIFPMVIDKKTIGTLVVGVIAGKT
jgi:hypothetical protein